MSIPVCQPSFKTLDGRRCFVNQWLAAGEPRANVLVAQPFGDEASLTRRMTRKFAEQAAPLSVQTHLFDYSGTGDSSGEFSDGRWCNWQNELADLAQQLSHPQIPLFLLGVRLGACLALEHVVKQGNTAGLIVWAPVFEGRAQLRQLKRIARHGASQDDGASIDQIWANGGCATIGGLAIHPGLANELELAKPMAKLGPGGRLGYLEVRALADSESGLSMSPVATRQIREFEQAGWSVDSLPVDGAGFWNVPDPIDCQALSEQTLALLDRWL